MIRAQDVVLVISVTSLSLGLSSILIGAVAQLFGSTSPVSESWHQLSVSCPNTYPPVPGSDCRGLALQVLRYTHHTYDCVRRHRQLDRLAVLPKLVT
jgi:hypothetical protein